MPEMQRLITYDSESLANQVAAYIKRQWQITTAVGIDEERSTKDCPEYSVYVPGDTTVWLQQRLQDAAHGYLGALIANKLV
jgi:hypothetical protein